jgi:hypothetical protein
MIDFAFALFLAVIAFGIGKLILDRLGNAPQTVIDRFALALPLGFGALSLATLAIGELGYLNRLGLSVVLGIAIELGLVSLWRDLRRARPASNLSPPWGEGARTAGEGAAVALPGAGPLTPNPSSAPSPPTYRGNLSSEGRRADGNAAAPDVRRLRIPVMTSTGLVLLGTGLCALAPVTDGDALCYHLQVPKVFLTTGSVGFAPDLHETVYPLVTELLYGIALEFRGPGACRWIQWFFGLVFAANAVALARPILGNAAWLAGAIALSVPAVSNGMSAPLNDVALAAFGTAAITAWMRLTQGPRFRSAILAGAFAGLAIGVKYPALVLCGLLFVGISVRTLLRSKTTAEDPAGRWLVLACVYLGVMAVVGGCWYVRAYVHTGNPVYPYFRQFFGNSGLAEVLAPDKRPLAVTPWNLAAALVSMSLEPDRFDSFSHQFGPVFLLFLPALFFERAPRRVLGLVGLAYLFLMICLTQRQSMRFVLLALGPMSVGVAYLAMVWSRRRTLPARLLLSCLFVALVFEAGLALGRARHALAFAVGHESRSDYLARVEPTFCIGRWAAANLPATASLIGQDHRGFYIPRPYTMELAHRRRTGLGSHGETAGQIIAHLRQSGFTHVLLCPPVPETAVEFDPTLSRLLGPWLARRQPLYRQELRDGDGVVRRYAIYDIGGERLSAGAAVGVTR